MAVAASAAPGDYTVEIAAPESVAVGDGFTYTVTIAGEPVVSNATLTTKLAEGVVFESVPTGPDSPVASYEYDPGSRTVTFTLKDLQRPLTSFVFSVTQDENQMKDESSVFAVEITGSATGSGNVPSDRAVSKVTGQWGYSATKSHTTVVGSGNREVTYFFNVGGPRGNTNTFSTWAQRLTDILPAGIEIRGSSTAPGAWVMTPNPDGTTTAVWQRDQPYGPQGTLLTSETGIWISVYYPSSEFPDGQRPPENTVSLEVKDYSGNWRTERPASTQVLELGQGSSKQLALDKTVEGGEKSAEVGNGVWVSSYRVRAAYLNSVDSENLDRMTVTDQYSGNEQFFDHMETYRLAVRFNSTLQSAALPFNYEYTTNARTSWQSFDTSSLTTASDFMLVTQVAGSRNFQNDEGYNQVLDLRAGERITGWRITVGAGDGGIRTGSQVSVEPRFIASYPSLDDGNPVPSAALRNTASVNGTLANGQPMAGVSDVASVVIADRVPIITVVTAPSVVETGMRATYQAKIANLDPAGRSYRDSVMRVVLPAGVVYDSQVGISAAYASTPTSGIALPTPGNGLAVTTEMVTTDGVERQIIVFTFDQLDSVRAWDSPKDRREWEDMFAYDIPVEVLPQAYDSKAAQIPVESWAYTNDPRYAGIPMDFVSAYLARDLRDFSATQDRIARSLGVSRVVTSGGLLLGKTVRESPDSAWSLNASVESPARVAWQIYLTNTLPNSFSDLLVFDRLPVIGDARGSEFPVTLSGAVVTSSPGVNIEYSEDATAPENGTWTDNPASAKAIRVRIASLNSGESLSLVAPTSVPEGVRNGATAVNNASAHGKYNGAQRDFRSNRAVITVQTPVEPPVEPPVQPPVEPPVQPTTAQPEPTEAVGGGNLPNTGGQVAGAALLAAILLLGGIIALIVGRRRGQRG